MGGRAGNRRKLTDADVILTSRFSKSGTMPAGQTAEKELFHADPEISVIEVGQIMNMGVPVQKPLNDHEKFP
ncbi:hypothetical protein ACSAZL_10215 [Methanosarcina sp. T3]|uniref:hypothetical protein n=1 Tax=Methanosarcina sp. T3 TaxID=3439062 RepID=UPI003F87B549